MTTPLHATASPQRRGLVTVCVLALLLALNMALPGTAQDTDRATPSAQATPSEHATSSEQGASGHGVGRGNDKIPPGLARQLDDGDAVDFWIEFAEQADLSEAAAIADWDERGRAVAQALRDTASRSQKGVVNRLRARGLEFESFWATNAIKVHGGDTQLAHHLATRDDVAGLWQTFTVTPPEVSEGATVQTAAAVEWGIANIRAERVWADEASRGEGIVIANIDTGVQYDHPALVGQYRGRNADGSFTHDYNWFDTRDVCRGTPCDDNGHGTHTMGTMVGDGGEGNHIGVAPGATWIATNGCCRNDATLVASGQWILEPTDRVGNHPDASKRPHIVNNSWGTNTPSTAPFMEDISNAWTASGIFATWSNGNLGPSCDTSGSPGSRAINHSVGAHDSANTIASFSSRGSGQDGIVKPDISAPGVNVRSSLPGNEYGSLNGTSMAAPHVAGSIALLWATRPATLGDVDWTRSALDTSAVDVNDTTCGGTADDNNVYGQGRLNAQALVDSVPLGPVGIIAGTASDADTGAPLAGVTIQLTGPIDRSLVTGDDGTVEVQVPEGTYHLTASKFGYGTRTHDTVVVTNDTTTPVDLAMDPVPTATVSGTVTDGSGHGWPLYARVDVPGTPVFDFTDPVTGAWEVQLPVGSAWDLTVTAVYPGHATHTTSVTPTADGSRVDTALAVDDCAAAVGYDADCQPVPGGLVVGQVTDTVTGLAVSGAKVVDVAHPDVTTTSATTPEDGDLDEGFHWQFTPHVGAQVFEATLGRQYSPERVEATVQADAVTQVDFDLGAGRLEVSTTELDATAEFGQSTTATVEVTNTGTAQATFEVVDREAGFVPAWQHGMDGGQVASMQGAPTQRLEVDVSPLRASADMALNEASDDTTTTNAAPWESFSDHPVPIMDNIAGAHEGRLYSFGGTSDGRNESNAAHVLDPASNVWREVTPMPNARMKPSGGVFDGEFVVTGGWGEPGVMIDTTVIYDPRTDSWSNGTPIPASYAASGSAILDGTLYVVGGCRGTCGTRVAQAYDIDADLWRRIADYPEPTSWLACGALDDLLYCAGGIGGGSNDSASTYAYDPDTNDWWPMASMPKRVWGGVSWAANGRLHVSSGVANGAITNAGWSYDPADDSWSPLPNANHALYRGGGACGAWRIGGTPGNFIPVSSVEHLPGQAPCPASSQDAAWLTASPSDVTLQPGESTTVTLTMDAASVDQPGVHHAEVDLRENTPFDVERVAVTFDVRARPSDGKLSGTVASLACDGTTSPLAGTTVTLRGAASTWTLTTDADGSWSRWIDRNENPIEVIVHQDGWIPQVTTAGLRRTTTVVDFTLPRRDC